MTKSIYIGSRKARAIIEEVDAKVRSMNISFSRYVLRLLKEEIIANAKTPEEIEFARNLPEF